VKLVNTFREIGFTRQQRLAILYSVDPHRRARLFAFISTLRGWSVRAFDDFEKAINWLSSGQDNAKHRTPSPAEKSIKVHSAKPELPAAPLPVTLLKRRKKESIERKSAIPIL
jgi:hypothetical protein